MATWLPTTEGEGAAPRVIDQGLESDLVYARPPELVAWGTVDGVPWRVQSAITAPGPDAHWWDHGPVGPELVFMLGRDDAFGGGGVHTRIEAGKQLSASIEFFGSQPAIVAWVGVVSDDVAAIEVRLDDGDVRAIEVHEGPDGFPNLFWVLPAARRDRHRRIRRGRRIRAPDRSTDGGGRAAQRERRHRDQHARIP